MHEWKVNVCVHDEYEIQRMKLNYGYEFKKGSVINLHKKYKLHVLRRLNNETKMHDKHVGSHECTFQDMASCIITYKKRMSWE